MKVFTMLYRHSRYVLNPVPLCLLLALLLPFPILSQVSFPPVDADTLHFYNEHEFRDFLAHHGLKNYSIKPQEDFYDCTVNPGTTIYTDQHDDDFLHEERFVGKPLIFIVDHNGTRKIYNILIPSLGDESVTTCDVRLYLTNPATGQVAVFEDVYNWIDENGQNIFNMNKKIYFLWGYNSGSHDFPAEMIQTTTGIDFTFPDYFPEDAGPITLIFTGISMYNQSTFYADADGDGYGDAAVDSMDYVQPLGYVTNSSDCNDADPAAYPGATELDNDADDDCDGLIDEDIPFLVYLDLDGDGYGNPDSAIAVLELPSGYVANAADCNDSDFNISPSASEWCNGVDDNCNGVTDETSTTLALTPAGLVNACHGDTLWLQAAEAAGYTYSWFKDGLPLPATSAQMAVVESGSYYALVSADFLCSYSTDTAVITFQAKPAAWLTAGTDLDLCTAPAAGIVKLRSNLPAGATLEWLRDDEVVAVGNRSRSFNLPGTYQTKVTNIHGCSKTSNALTVIDGCREAPVSANNQVLELEVFPNPAQTEIHIRFLSTYEAGNLHVQLMNAQGQWVKEYFAASASPLNAISLSVADLPPGVYWLQVQGGVQLHAQWLVVE